MAVINLGPCECCGGQCRCGPHPLPTTITAEVISRAISPTTTVPEYAPSQLLGLEIGDTHAGQLFPESDCLYLISPPLPDSVQRPNGASVIPCPDPPYLAVQVISQFGNGTYSPHVRAGFVAAGVDSTSRTRTQCYSGELLDGNGIPVQGPNFWRVMPAVACASSYEFDIELRGRLYGDVSAQFLDIFVLGLRISLG